MKGPIARSVLQASLLACVAYHHAGAGQQLYQVTPLSSNGGAVSRGNSINNRGWIAGYSNLPGDQNRHATLWANGSRLDLGTLGGPNSSVAWPVKNNHGLLAGIAQTATPEPLGERWSCSAFFPGATGTGYTCLGFAWKNGVMKALPTLGGHNGFATGANDRGQIVGWAENTVHDPTCVPPQVLQFHAVIWGPEEGRVRPLPPLPGDSSSAGTAINDRGQVVGISGTCDQAVGRFTARHAVLWEDGTVNDIGAIGGETWNTPMAINQQGDVVGFASLPGSDPDDPVLHAIFWSRDGGIRDLGTLPGDATSEAHGINGRRQVVGLSCGASDCRAFLWEDGVMTDLNTLVAPGYSGHLYMAQDVNDIGEITGRAVDPETGELPAFLAVPVPATARRR
jgi:probable HAF family extracellular repeat protein